MKGLLTKEFIVLFKNNKYQLFLILCFAVLGIGLKEIPYILLIPVLMPMLIVQGLAMDETSKWDRYSICFPADRKLIVSSKYVMVIIAALFSAVIITLSAVILKMRNAISVEDMKMYIITASAVSLIMPSMVLPFDFKFGVAKGKVITYICTAFLAVVVAAIFTKGDGPSIFKNLTGSVQPFLFIFGCSAAIFAVSWFISAKAYESREI